MRTIQIVATCILLVWNFSSCFGTNPIKRFCSRNGVNTKAVLIAMDLSDCSNCYIAPADLFSNISRVNRYIPVYIVMKDSLTDGERMIFRKKLGDEKERAIFVSDKIAYNFMVSKNKGMPTLCSVSPGGKILEIKHLKHDEMGSFFKSIKSEFEFMLTNKFLLTHKLIDPGKSSSMIHLKNEFFLFYKGINLIAAYNAEGENIRNVWLDSLDINYLQLAKVLFTKNEYEHSVRVYNNRAPKKSQLISPVTSYGDTIMPPEFLKSHKYKAMDGKRVGYQQRYACLLFFDSDLNYLGFKSFYPFVEATVVDLSTLGCYTNSLYYFGRYDTESKECVMAEYLQNDTVLTLIRQFKMPQKEEQSLAFAISSTGSKSIYITYPKAKGEKISSAKVYKLNLNSGVFSEVMGADFQVHPSIKETPEGNMVFLGKQENSFVVKGFDKKGNSFLSASPEKHVKVFDSTPFYFAYNGYIWEYAFIE